VQRKTYFVGASLVSIEPLMNVARECVAVLMSACSLEMFNFASSSSRTWTEALFSLVVVDIFAKADSVTGPGIMVTVMEEERKFLRR
jgi:hypothetical protein